MYNALTDGIRITNAASYPNDSLVSNGLHVVLHALKDAGLIAYTESMTAPVAPVLNQVHYKPDSGLNGNAVPVGDAYVRRWDGTVWQALTPAQYANYLQAFMSLGGGGVSNADYGDITVTGTGNVWTIDPNVVTNAKSAKMPALAVKVNATNALADAQDIQAASTGEVLMRSGTALVFALIGSANIAADAVGNAQLANMSAYSFKANNNAVADNPTDVSKATLTNDTTPVATDSYLAFDAVTGGLKQVEHQYVASGPLDGTSVGSYIEVVGIATSLSIGGTGASSLTATLAGTSIRLANPAGPFSGCYVTANTGSTASGLAGTWARRGATATIVGAGGSTALYQRIS